MMNERLQELADQAKKYADEYWDYSTSWLQFYNEKFAELIIGKCIDRIKRVGVLEDIENETDMVIDDVKEYFGVK